MDINKNIQYSIIIPHRNRPHLLLRLLGSIPPRDDIQVIVVDDNSESSIANADFFRKIESQGIVVIRLEKCRGAGHARNLGLQHAKGTWVLFADCDDYFITIPFSTLLATPKPNNCEVLVWNAEFISDKETHQYQTDLAPFVCHTDTDSLYLNHLPVWTKMIRQDIIEKTPIRFEETMHANDVMFAAILSQEITCYHTTATSIYVYDTTSSHLTKSRALKSILTRTNAELRALCYLKKKGKFIWHGPYWLGELCRKNYHIYLFFILRCLIHLGVQHTKYMYTFSCRSVGVSPTPYKTFIKRKGRWINK